MQTHLSARRFAGIQGRRIAYRVAGRADGSPIVLIHALASRSDSWDRTAGALAESGFRVIAPDLRGHGGSAWAASYAMADFVDDLIAMLDAMHLDRVDLIGHSLGGHLALCIAACAPHRVRRLVIEATPVPPRDDVDAANLRAQDSAPSWRRALRTLGMGRMLWRVLRGQFDIRASGPVIRALRSPMPQWWRDLASIGSPSLLLVGRNGGGISGRIGLLLAGLPGSRAIFLGDGHHLHAEHFDAFMAEVSPFLAADVPAPAHASGVRLATAS